MAASGVKNPPSHAAWCHTHVKGHIPFSYKWTIHNLSLRREKPGQKLNSSIFSAGNNDQRVELQLSVYPKGDSHENANFLSLFLNVVNSNGSKVRTDVAMSILNAKQKDFHTLYFIDTIENGSGYGWPTFINRTRLMKHLLDDRLTLLCKGSIILEGTLNTSGKSSIVKFVVPKCAALHDLGQLLESREFTDITIFVGDEKIQAHRAILAARSTVFCQMFESETEEAKENRLEISDIEPKVFLEMIRFIYTGKAPNIKEVATGLITAADKYDLRRLKVMCAEALFKSLSRDNAADILVLADQHNEEQLMVQTIDFIITHLKHVIDTASFKIMADSYPHLTDKILRRTVRQDDSEESKLPSESSDSE